MLILVDFERERLEPRLHKVLAQHRACGQIFRVTTFHDDGSTDTHAGWASQERRQRTGGNGQYTCSNFRGISTIPILVSGIYAFRCRQGPEDLPNEIKLHTYDKLISM